MAKRVDTERIGKAMANLDMYEYGDVLQCMRCGLCLPTCPTYRTDGLETQSPRGRVAMIRAVIDGQLPAAEEFITHMYHCLDCRSCQTVCPAGVKAGELVLEARHRIEKNRPQPLLKRFILEYAIKDQKRLARYTSPLKLYQYSGLQSLIRKYHVLTWISEDLALMEELLPPLPLRPLSETLPEEIPAIGRQRGRIGFFLGCAMNLIFADVSRATVELLTRAGYTAVIPKGIKCCGAPNIAEGERNVYREMAEHNIALFEDKNVEAVVTDCAACGSELKSYREVFARSEQLAERARGFSTKVRDVSEFLVSAFGPEITFGSIPEQVCFHDPCHLRHAQGLTLPQRQLLGRIPGLVLREIPDEGQCCGSAGIYNVTHRERAMKILETKVAAIQQTGAQRVVTSNPGCHIQLLYATRRWGTGWSVSHISEIVSRALRQSNHRYRLDV